MKVLLLKLPEERARDILLILKVKWPDLTSFRADETTEALHLIRREQPHLAILNFPERNNGASTEECFDLIGEIHSSSALPLIILGRDHDLRDRVRALEMGAHDWVSTGFSPMEFIAKVGAILRRCRPPQVRGSLLRERHNLHRLRRPPGACARQTGEAYSPPVQDPLSPGRERRAGMYEY